MIPSEGTVTVVRAAEWVIRQAASTFKKSQPIKLLEVMYIGREFSGASNTYSFLDVALYL